MTITFMQNCSCNGVYKCRVQSDPADDGATVLFSGGRTGEVLVFLFILFPCGLNSLQGSCIIFIIRKRTIKNRFHLKKGENSVRHKESGRGHAWVGGKLAPHPPELESCKAAPPAHPSTPHNCLHLLPQTFCCCPLSPAPNTHTRVHTHTHMGCHVRQEAGPPALHEGPIRTPHVHGSGKCRTRR